MVSRGAVYTLNNIGPRTDPCGTPNFRGNSLDVQEPILMHWERSDRYNANHALALPPTPNCLSMLIVSKTADRSKITRRHALLTLKAVDMSFVCTTHCKCIVFICVPTLLLCASHLLLPWIRPIITTQNM